MKLGMQFRTWVLCLATGVFLLPVCGASVEQFSWNGALSAGQGLEVIAINGGINVSPSVGNAVAIGVEKRTSGSSLDDVQVKVEQLAEGIVVCALYRNEDSTFPSGCKETDRAKRRTKRNVNVTTTFTIQMPASSNLKVATVNGGIKVVGLAAQVDASSVNGGIDVATTGRASARTVNGGVHVNVGRLDQDCRFSTVNGKIVLAVAGPVNADLSASTVNGRIETDFPITAMGSLSRRSLKGRIGNGGPQLELSTVNGGIRIERLSASASM
jgi:hypothetical protein